jgi:hypothetical protein
MTLSMKSLAVIVLAALLVLAVTLAVLLVPSISWAASSFYEWFTHPGASPCACEAATKSCSAPEVATWHTK